jgi:hypothetical protein
MRLQLRETIAGLFGAGALVLTGLTPVPGVPSAHADTAPGYITLLVGRGMYGKMTGGKLDPQVLTLDQVAPTLQSMGLWAAGNVVVTRTAETTRTVHSGNSYASWADWQRHPLARV